MTVKELIEQFEELKKISETKSFDDLEIYIQIEDWDVPVLASQLQFFTTVDGECKISGILLNCEEENQEDKD